MDESSGPQGATGLGHAKQRPAIILTATADIRDDEPFLAIAITTSFDDPPPDDHVPLPWDPRGRAATKLRKRSAAVLSWIVEVESMFWSSAAMCRYAS